MIDPRQFLDQFDQEEDTYDDEAMETALYGDMTRVLLEKAKRKKDASLRYQEQQRQLNQQAMVEAEKAGV